VPRGALKQHQLLANDGRPDGGLPTGGLVVLMNNTVFKSPLINYTREFPFVWVSLRYNITFESNWERAREVILEALNSEPEITDTVRQAKEYFAEMSASFSVKEDPLDPVVRSWTAGVGVELTARFLAHPRRRAHLIDTVNLKILRIITQSDDIRFTYWTIRSVSTPGKTVPQNEQPHSQDPLTAK
jgi:small-conductance mechanosensitive channel